MTKVAVYGFVRVVFDLLGPAGLVVEHRRARRSAASRPCSACSSALMQRDLKRLLAYSTVENIGIIFIGLGLALAFKANGMRRRRAGVHGRAVPRLQSLVVQEPAVLRRGRRAARDGRARHREARRADPSACRMTAFLLLGGCVAISALPPLNGFVSEWLTFQADPAEPRAAAVGPEAAGAGGRRHAGAGGGAVGGLLRARLRHRLPGPAAHAEPPSGAHETDVFSRTRWFAACRAVPAGRPAAGLRHRCAGAGGAERWSAAACRARAAIAWLSIVPVAESRSSYNGLLVFVFIAVSTLITARDHPPLRLARACAAARPGTAASPIRVPPRSTPPTASPSRSAACSASRVPRARARRHAAAGGRPAGAAHRHAARSRLGCALRPDRRRRLVRRRAAQPPAVPDHPPIPEPGVRRSRRACCWCCRYGPDPRSRRAGAADGAGARAGAAAAGLHAQGEGAHAAPPRTAGAAALPRPPAPHPQGGRDRRQRLLALPQRPLHDLRRHLGGRRPGADVRHRPHLQLGRRPHRHHRAARLARASFSRSSAWTSAPASAASAPAAR